MELAKPDVAALPHHGSCRDSLRLPDIVTFSLLRFSGVERLLRL